jgi:hypothetical protein
LSVHREESTIVDDLFKILKPFKPGFLPEDREVTPDASQQLASK